MDKDNLTIKQEKFCLEYVKTGNGKQSAITAGYSPDSAVTTASEILTYPNVIKKINELKEKIESKNILNVIQRKELLTKFAREEIKGKHGVVRDSNIKAIAELNKMEGDYAPTKTEITGEGGKPVFIALLERLRGFNTAEIIESEATELPEGNTTTD